MPHKKKRSHFTFSHRRFGANSKQGTSERGAARRKIGTRKIMTRKIMTKEDYDQGRYQQRAPAISPFLLNVSAHCLFTLLLTLCWYFQRIRTLFFIFDLFNVFVRCFLILLMGASKNEPSRNFSLYLVMCCIGSVGLEGSSLPSDCSYWFAVLYMEEIDVFIIIIIIIIVS